MKKTAAIIVLTGIAWLMAGAPLAMAHDRSGVSWSVSIGSTYPPPLIYTPPPQVIYNPPPVVYTPQQPVYVQPYPVYVVPQPIYVQPAPIVRFGKVYHDGHRHPYHAGQGRRYFHSGGQHRWHN
jgi:hypothetical protein